MVFFYFLRKYLYIFLPNEVYQDALYIYRYIDIDEFIIKLKVCTFLYIKKGYTENVLCFKSCFM